MDFVVAGRLSSPFANAAISSSRIINGIIVVSLALASITNAQNDDLSLSLSLSMGPAGSLASMAGPSIADQHQEITPIMSKIMNDDYGEDFISSELAIAYLEQSMMKFAQSEGLDYNSMASGGLISSWLTRGDAPGQQVFRNPMIVMRAKELDYIYSTFWTQFKRLIQVVVMDRPPNLGVMDLAFRCERYAELKELARLASASSIYGMIADIFSSELYTHCLKRKLAVLKVNQIKPTSTLRQFVDIYLDISPHESLRAAQMSEDIQDSPVVQAGLSHDFDLQTSLARHGPLSSAAELVFDSSSFLASGSSVTDYNKQKLIEKFGQDCQNYTRQLEKVWSTFDDMASLFTSPTNNLIGFNNRIKFAVPQLAYSAICVQLMQMAV